MLSTAGARSWWKRFSFVFARSKTSRGEESKQYRQAEKAKRAARSNLPFRVRGPLFFTAHLLRFPEAQNDCEAIWNPKERDEGTCSGLSASIAIQPRLPVGKSALLLLLTIIRFCFTLVVA